MGRYADGFGLFVVGAPDGLFDPVSRVGGKTEAAFRVELIDRVQREPVRVTRRNRVVGVMVSPEDYAAMRAFYADRLASTLRETANEAVKKGLTDSELERLLSDEG